MNQLEGTLNGPGSSVHGTWTEEGGGTWGIAGLDLLNNIQAFQLPGAKSESGPWE